MKWINRVALVLIIVAVGWWLWQRVFVSDEGRIRTQLSSMTHAVEQGNLLRLESAIANDYSDDKGLDKSTLLGGMRACRKEYDRLLIYLSDLTITIETNHQKAQAVFVAKVLAKAKGGGGETEMFNDRFRLFFRKTDRGWQLYRAESPRLKFD